jgi:regulator of sigma E protease
MELIYNFTYTAVAFLVIISIIVFLHEFGHYLAARLCGVKIEAFAIGFGKELFGWTDKAGTRWKICVAPLGGYVKMFGDATEASTPDAEKLENLSEEEKKLTFHHKNLWQKSIIVAAGPLANFITAFVIFTALIMTTGLNTTKPIVGDVLQDSAAEAAGLQKGDEILSIDGRQVRKFDHISPLIMTNLGEEVEIKLKRDGELITVRLTPKIVESEDGLGNKVKRPMIGISSQKIMLKDVGVLEAMVVSAQRIYQMIEMSLEFLGQIITGGRSADELKGPIGIADMSGKVAKKDWGTIFFFMALISVNLGFVNILPIPPLDGGHLLFYVIEGAQGRKVAEKVQMWGYKVGFAIILSLMGFTIFNDIRQLIMS